MKTHEVINQVPPLENYNLYKSDRVLQEWVKREGAGWAEKSLSDLGKILGTPEIIKAGFLANENRPILKTHNRFGERVDEVEFHPSYHQVFAISTSFGIHASPWKEPKTGAHVARAAAHILAYQNEAGHMCPVTMTYGCIPTLRKQPEIAKEWEAKAFSYEYDPRFVPIKEKKGVIFGMAMTEKQGGSDVRSNTTKAAPIGRGGPGGEYLVTGHKWFCSAPMSDAFFVLAQAPKGLSCFLVPRWLPDGKRNRFFIQRLKDKLGDRSNASSEVEFEDTWGRMIGEEGRGVPTIIEMANYTRLDCALAGASLMRHSLAQALHHVTYRSAFGKTLVDQPLMENVLADLCLESEAATALVMRLARAYDKQDDQEVEGPFRRIATAIAKFWLTKRSIYHVAEALEVHGGNGFVEESVLPRLLRQAPLNSVWEGSGNVMCLDVLRAMAKEPRSIEVLLDEIREGASKNKNLKSFLQKLETNLKQDASEESQARHLIEQLALALQGSILLQHGDPKVAELFLGARLSEQRNLGFGTLPKGTDFRYFIDRNKP